MTALLMDVVVPLVLVALVAWALYAVITGGGTDRMRLEAVSRWETHTESGNGVTLVVVRRVAEGRRGMVELGRQTIESIPDGAPDWDLRYHEAMAEARVRLAALESESGTGG